MKQKSSLEGEGRPILPVSLALLGMGLVFGSFVLGSYDFGSCPGAQPGQPVCDHTMMLGGITFQIGATANLILILGALVLVSSLGVGLNWMKKRKPQKLN
jgi:hypothetical protein